MVFDLSKFSVPAQVPVNLFGPVGRGDIGEKFYRTFRAKQIGVVTVVGRRDGKGGCFTVSGDEIGFYETETPQQVCEGIKSGNPIEAIYRPIDHSFKYLYIQMVQILMEFDVVW